MYRIVATIALVSLAVSLAVPMPAQNKPPEVDRDSVIRTGNLVQHINGPFKGDDSLAFSTVMGPPENDNDKWFISVVGQKNDAASLKLKRDWDTHPELQVLARPNLADQKKSWAHFNWYDKDDRSQSFRFEKLKISAWPTVLVQPPRTGQYGDPKIVVYQGVYQGDPKKLADAIREAIRKYLAKIPLPIRTEAKPAIGLDPPFSPPPKADPNLDLANIFPNPRAPDDVVPPPVQPEPKPEPKPEPLKPLVNPFVNLPWWATMGIGAFSVFVLQWLGRRLKPDAELALEDDEEEETIPPTTSYALVMALQDWQEQQAAKAEEKAREAEETAELRKVLLEVAEKLAK